MSKEEISSEKFEKRARENAAILLVNEYAGYPNTEFQYIVSLSDGLLAQLSSDEKQKLSEGETLSEGFRKSFFMITKVYPDHSHYVLLRSRESWLEEGAVLRIEHETETALDRLYEAANNYAEEIRESIRRITSHRINPVIERWKSTEGEDSYSPLI